MKFKAGDLLRPSISHKWRANWILVLGVSVEKPLDNWYCILNGEEITRWNVYYVDSHYEKVIT